MSATPPDRLVRWRERVGRWREHLGQWREHLERLRERVDRWREWTRRSLSTLIGLGLILVLLLIANAGAEDYSGLAELAEREAELEFELEEAKLRVESLRRAVVLLQDDPIVLERLAREELGLVRPGDRIVVLPRAGD